MAIATGRTEILEETTAPPRARILQAARELFYSYGIHMVGVDAVAEAAGTNKTTLYRHFASKDELVAECLRECGREIEKTWTEIEQAYIGKPKDQLLAWLRFIAEFKLGTSERGCAFANAAVELPDADHPARRVIEEYKNRHRDLIIELCRKAELRDPELLADELFLLGEGARLSVQSLGPKGPARRLAEMFETLVAAHTAKGSRSIRGAAGNYRYRISRSGRGAGD